MLLVARGRGLAHDGERPRFTHRCRFYALVPESTRLGVLLFSCNTSAGGRAAGALCFFNAGTVDGQDVPVACV